MRSYNIGKIRSLVIVMLIAMSAVILAACSSDKNTDGEAKKNETEQSGTLPSMSKVETNGNGPDISGSTDAAPGAKAKDGENAGEAAGTTASGGENDDTASGDGDDIETDGTEDELYDEYGGEGYLGSVEVEERDCPFLVYDNVGYYIDVDHAVVFYNIIVDCDLEQYTVLPEIEYQGVKYPVTIIEESAFDSYTQMTTIYLPATIEEIGTGAFDSCYMLENVIIPESVTTIADGAFASCEALKEVIIPDSVVSMGCDVFYGCTSLKSAKLSAGMENVPAGIFSECTSLESVIIPENVKVIGAEAFWDCMELKNIELPEGLVTIEESAFYSCEGLTVLTIPATIQAIDESSFDYCTNLLTVKLPSDKKDAFSEIFEFVCDAEIVAY